MYIGSLDHDLSVYLNTNSVSVCITSTHKQTVFHLDVRAARNLDAGSAVSNDIVLGYLAAAAESDTVAAVLVDAVTTELHPAVPLDDDTAAAIVLDAIRHQPRQLAALEHGDA